MKPIIISESSIEDIINNNNLLSKTTCRVMKPLNNNDTLEIEILENKIMWITGNDMSFGSGFIREINSLKNKNFVFLDGEELYRGNLINTDYKSSTNTTRDKSQSFYIKFEIENIVVDKGYAEIFRRKHDLNF